MIRTYVDPGQGFVFLQQSSYLWGLLLGALGIVLFLGKFFFRLVRRFFFILLALAVILIVGGILMQKNHPQTKVIILGIDAMDPEITEQLMRQGRLPHLAALKEKGAYQRLETTMPSETVVAWTSFSTGLAPGAHGIFDFIMRDPKTYLPYLSMNETTSAQRSVTVRTRKKGESFWSRLSQKKIPAFIYFCPNTFPPEQLLGKMLSGMGTPDLLGTMGRFSFYTTASPRPEDKDSRGNIICVQKEEGNINTFLYGPRVKKAGVVTETKVALGISLVSDGQRVKITLPTARCQLQPGQWSPWQKVSFRMGFMNTANGIVKFYLKSISPEFQLYATALNIDPRTPLLPLSYPPAYSRQLAHKLGPYATQGMPHDTWGLSEDRLNEEAFLQETDALFAERRAILQEALAQFKGGLLFFYFDTLDAIQHMFWRFRDERHPLYEKNSAYADTINRYYEKFDQLTGELMARLDADTTLIVLSDHGCGPFRKAVHLNRWLKENGYLALKAGAQQGGELLEDIDWSGTKAYALGFGGIYLNRIGREYYGIVDEPTAARLKKEIAAKLLLLRDPKTKEPVVHRVYLQEEVFVGPQQDSAPDLFVGFNRGFRASWQTALGATPLPLIEENRKKWSGDHLVDSALVPGVLFYSRPLPQEGSRIDSIAAVLLGLFNQYPVNHPERNRRTPG